MIEIKNVTLMVKDKIILQGFTKKISNGKICIISGKNGSGKSTLMKAIVNNSNIASGNITMKTNNYTYMPQDISIDNTFPIRIIDVVAMGLYKNNLFKKIDKDKIYNISERLGINHILDKFISTVSGGQLQLALFARSLITDADLFLFDEPFANLDAYVIDNLIKILYKLKQSGKTILIITHDALDKMKYAADEEIII